MLSLNIDENVSTCVDSRTIMWENIYRTYFLLFFHFLIDGWEKANVNVVFLVHNNAASSIKSRYYL